MSDERGRDGRRRWLIDALRGAPALIGLAGLAITQPVLDLFGRNPEFFVAGSYAPSQIIAFGVLVAAVPAAIAIVAVVVASLVHRRVGFVVRLLLASAFAVTFGLVLARTFGVDATLPAFAIAAAVAGVIVVLEHRTRAGALVLRYLAAGNVLFLGFFLVASPTSDLVRGGRGGDLGHGHGPDLDGPVVVIVLDELPVSTLMTPEGRVNGERFPAFADLAAHSTWFRNASTHYSFTPIAVPDILTGRRTKPNTLPTYREHPRSLLTLLGGSIPVNRYERITELCPPEVCEPRPRSPLSQAIEDSAIVYGHRVLPESLRSDLPDIDVAWGQFGDTVGTDPDDVVDSNFVVRTKDESVAPEGASYARWRARGLQRTFQGRQAATIVARGALITREPALHVTHVVVPHQKWWITPWLHSNTSYPDHIEDPKDPGYAFNERVQYQLHTMQTGAVDRALGDVIARLREVGAWDDALVVVAADHGMSLFHPDWGRPSTARNKEEVLRVPLFIKAPGQRAGRVDDQPAALIDVMPSIVDLLDIETNWKFDGHSLYDGSKRKVGLLVGLDVRAAIDLARRHAALHAGLDWTGLAGFGPNKDLIGSPTDRFTTGARSTLRWHLNERAMLARLPTEKGALPYSLTGTVRAPDGSRPPELVVAVNGRISGIVGGYNRPRDGAWQLQGTITDGYRDGANVMVAYEVERTNGRVVFHEVPFE